MHLALYIAAGLVPAAVTAGTLLRDRAQRSAATAGE
jgi:hypothetical protein